MTTLQTKGPLLLNGQSVVCPQCGSGAALDLDRCGLRETWPAWVSCRDCGHGDDHQTITNGLVEAALAARTGRATREDRDLFAAQWRDLLLVGECRPEFILDDARALVEELSELGRQEYRERKQEARTWWNTQKRAARRAVRGAVGQTTGTVKAAALRAAWDAQTGGAGPHKPPPVRCRAKGCRGGWITIITRAHTPGQQAEKVQTPCAVCHRA